MIDKSHIGALVSSHTQVVEAGRLRFFAKATQQQDACYSDEAAALDAGYPLLPVPPTFLFCLDMEAGAQPPPSSTWVWITGEYCTANRVLPITAWSSPVNA